MTASACPKPRRVKRGAIPVLLAPLLCLTLVSFYNVSPFARDEPRFPRISAAQLRRFGGGESGGEAGGGRVEKAEVGERVLEDGGDGVNDGGNDGGNVEIVDGKEEDKVEPLLTLVLTTYNVQPFLNETLSTLNLTSRIHLLTVDDASTDNTLRALQTLPRNNILSLSCNTPGGVGTPSNLALESITTKYVAFLDGDDLLSPNTLHSMLDLAEKTSAQVVYADFTRFRDTPKGRVWLRSYDADRWPSEHVRMRSQNDTVGFGIYQSFGMSPVPWRKLYNVQFLRDHGIRFPEGDFVFEDNAFHWLVTTYATRVVYLNESVVAHRIGREGQSTSAFRHATNVTTNDEAVIKTRKSGAGMAHYIANQDFIGHRLLECENGIWRCNTAREKFLTWVTGSDWVTNIVHRAGDRKITAKFRSLKARSAEYWRNTMARRFPDIPKGRWFTKPLRFTPAPELSIVVPVFNDMRFIDAFLDNLASLNTTHEVIFVDNNSTDGSLAHLERITRREENLLLLHTPKSGAGRARNLGMLFAEGEHVLFLDCDDRVDASALDDLVLHAQTSRAEVTFVKYALEYARLDSSGISIRRQSGMFASDEKLFNAALSTPSLPILRTLAGPITNYPWNKLVRRELLLRENVFFGSTLVNNDVLFHWHAVLTAKSIQFYDRVVTYHRKFDHGERITDKGGSERLQLVDALGMTNRVLVGVGIEGLAECWGEFVRKLLEWGRGRVGREWRGEYERRAKVVREIVKRGGVELVLRE